MVFKRQKSKLISCTLFLALSACATNDPGYLTGDEILVPAPEFEPNTIDAVLNSEKFKPKTFEAPEIGAEEDEINLAIKQGIPVEINEEVNKWIHFFTVKRPDLFQRYLDRGEKYKAMIVSILEEQEVPTELYYLALIESGFVQNARSHASAVGIWQFIRGTGKRYGLRIDNYVDERIDPHRATIAATLYLNDLRNVFNSWYLAMAAYNAGEGRIMRAIMKGKSRDFWELARNKHLPSETMNYVPKFMAAMIIGSDLAKYGFNQPEPQPAPNITSVTVPSGLRLAKVAEVIGMPYASLKEHNRHLHKKMTPPGLKNYHIWIPAEYEQQFADAESKLAQYVERIAATSTSNYHVVRRGETLSSISGRYGMTISELRRLNNMRGNRILAGSRLRVRGETAAVASRNDTPQYHRVARGENLTLIANRYGTTAQSLRKVNNLRTSRIYPGMRLLVGSSELQRTYRVRRGDNLHLIARRFGLTVAQLKRLNQLRRNTIYAGQVLTVAADQG
ncbi:MAG: LysM peptidoglycan-binding domain-containing protein [Oligoflexus sp.]